MASKGLLSVLLAAASFLAGAAISFAGLQTLMISTGFGDSSAFPTTSGDPGFRLPVSLQAMLGIDAAVAVAAAWWAPVSGAVLAAMPRRHRSPVRNLAYAALYLGAGFPFPVLPTCPVAPGAGCGDVCIPVSRAAVRRNSVVMAAAVVTLCALVYVNINYLDADDGEEEEAAARGSRRGMRSRED